MKPTGLSEAANRGRRTCFTTAVLGVACAITLGGQAARDLTGVLTSDSDANDQMELTITLSAQNRPIYRYESTSGMREVELTDVGQTIRFVPRGGGVRTLEVAALEASKTRIHWVLATSFEKSGMVLTQSYGKESATLIANGSGFDATFQIVNSTRLSDLDLAVGGDADVTVYRGVLR